MEIIHLPAEIMDRIVKGKDSLRGLDYWERYTFLNWLYLAYNPNSTDGQLEAVVEGRLEIRRILAAAERAIGPWAKVREWLTQPNAELGEARPIDLLATDGGSQVESLITRLAEKLSLEDRRAIGDVVRAGLGQDPSHLEIIEEIETIIAESVRDSVNKEKKPYG